MRIGVIGGGVAGLTCALRLRQLGHDPIVLEREGLPGGKIRTERVGDWQLELGPAGLLDNAPATGALFAELGLAPQVVVSADAARRRFVLRDGKLKEAPDSPPKILTSRALSLGEKWRLWREPKAPPPPEGVEETVADFARRRLGPELARRFVEPMVSGVFAGDYASLSVASAFPRLVALEREYGSLIGGLFALERQRRAEGRPRTPARLTSLSGGMAMLPSTLSARLGEAVRLKAEVAAIERSAEGLTVRTAGESLAFDRLVLALPPKEASHVCRSLDPVLADSYAAIPTVGITSVSLGFARDDVSHPLSGFGFLAPRIEGVRILGALWVTSTFPTLPQAPHDHVLLRCMIGGAHDPEASTLSDEALIASAREGLFTAMGLAAVPRFSHVARWRHGIAQYLLGHQERVATIEGRGAQFGLFSTGAALRGVGVHDVIREAQTVADRIHASG